MTAQSASGPVLNIDAAPLGEHASPDGAFKARHARMGPLIGCEKLGVMLTVLEPGARAFPLHAHHAIEELFFIVEGEGAYRCAGETHRVRAGDVLAAPTGGGDTAHQIVNTGNGVLKFLAVSTMDAVDVVDYPELGKRRVYAERHGLNDISPLSATVALYEEDAS